MLDDLRIHLTKAKATRYFKMCDAKGKGRIDRKQFEIALLAVDPNHPNRTNGFRPGAFLAPKDAFELFDEGGEGEISLDEFSRILEFLGLNIPDHEKEMMFSKYDVDDTGMIGYLAFKRLWVTVADVKSELIKRGATFNDLTPHFQLVEMLNEIIEREENLEDQAMKEAKWWESWLAEMYVDTERTRVTSIDLFNSEIMKGFCAKAMNSAEEELAQALDCAGQVYVFGKGLFDRFDGQVSRQYVEN